MNKGVLNSELFGCVPSRIKALFEGVSYPWEVIPRIERILDFCDTSGLREISDGIFVGEGVSISELATLLPPLVILDSVEIRPGAYLRGKAFIGEGAVIGNSSEIKSSVIMSGAQLPHYNYVGNSIIGHKAHLGAGAVCSNLRSDKMNVTVHGDRDYETGLRKLGAAVGDLVEVGCGAVLSPGSVIGRESIIYPQALVRGVIGEGMILKASGETVKKI